MNSHLQKVYGLQLCNCMQEKVERNTWDLCFSWASVLLCSSANRQLLLATADGIFNPLNKCDFILDFGQTLGDR